MKLPDKMVEAATEVIYGGHPCCGIDDQDIKIMTKALVAAAVPEMLDTLRKCQTAFDAMFGHCLSNGVFNRWGEPMNCTPLNNARDAVQKALRSIDATGVGENDDRTKM